jgi:hypothetical protein
MSFLAAVADMLKGTMLGARGQMASLMDLFVLAPDAKPLPVLSWSE